MFARCLIAAVLILTSPIWLPIVINNKWSNWQREQWMNRNSGELIFHPEDFGGLQY